LTNPDSVDDKTTLDRIGMSVETLTNTLANKYQLQKSEGALITHVFIGSPANLAGLRQGDIIIKCNRLSVKNVKDLLKILEDKSISNYLFLVDRRGNNMFVDVQLE
jgi:serine protease Do